MTKTTKPATPLPWPHHYSPACLCNQCQAALAESNARSERKFAQQERTGRHGSVESIRIHEQNAAEYEAKARALLAKLGEDK